ncbi:MAG: hypothetical protein EXS35_14290 [Pedosphaera sp.]|nr:hypothetical protein [Pedosphaera sp.]
MSDVQLLFVVLAVLYGWECACWLRRGSVAFSSWFGRGWQLFHPGALIGNQRGGFIFAAPLPPLGWFVTANQFPLSLSSDGVLAFVATNVNPAGRAAQSGRFIAWNDVRQVRARGRKVLVNGEVFLSLFSLSRANQLAEDLQRLAKLKPAQREPAIAELLRDTLDAKTVERRWQEALPPAKPVRLLSNVLFVYLVAFAPVLIWQFGLRATWLNLLLGLLALTATTAFFFRRAHFQLFPKAGDERFTHTLTILLAPVTATRAHDALLRPLFESFHPLAPAKVLLAEKDFREFARRVLLDLRHPALPVCPDEKPEVKATELHGRNALRAAAEKFLKQAGLEPDSLCRAPAPLDESCRAYCPRCEAQFTSADGQCADCGGLALVKFPKRA